MDTNSLTAVAQAAATAAHSAQSSAALNTIVVAIFGFLGVLVTTIGAILLARINSNAKGTKEAAQQAAAQSQANAGQLVQIHDVTRRVYVMVNKPFGVALEGAAKAMEILASLPGASDAHRQAAATARHVSDAHLKAMNEYDLHERVQAALTAAPPNNEEMKAKL